MLVQEKALLSGQITKLEAQSESLQLTLSRVLETEKLSHEQLKNLQAGLSGLSSIRDTLNCLTKSIGQKVDSMKVGDR
jgi:hypothetical protein